MCDICQIENWKKAHELTPSNCNLKQLDYELEISITYRNRERIIKHKIRQFLLAVLGNEDDYVDVSTLMLKITNYH